MIEKKYNVAVVGATGMVGRTMLSILEERNFPVDKVYALASSRSVGTRIPFKDSELVIGDLETFDFNLAEIGLFSPGASVSAIYAPKAVDAGCVVIDNTSKFRYEDDIPLVVSEVNPHTIGDYKNYIARLNEFPRYFDEQIILMKEGLRLGITIPQAVLNDYELTISAHIVSDPEMSLFFNPFNKIPKNIPKNDRKKLIQEGRQAILTSVVKAYGDFLDFFILEYRPGARVTLGATEMPN